MANVVDNPDFSAVDPVFGNVLSWTRTSWEPKLSLGGGSTGVSSGLSVVPGRGVRYSVAAEGRNELGLFPGVLYSGPGFDAGPGDVWRIQFDHQWANNNDEWQQFQPVRADDHHEIFFRYGVTIWNPVTNHWDAWYVSLPVQSILLPPDPRLSDGPGPVHYDVTFTVPANFPRAAMQFAICHTPNPFTAAQYASPTNGGVSRGYGLTMYLDNVDLELVSAGGPGAGSAPDDSFWAFWPTPRFEAGYPHAIPDFDVHVEWDQFGISAPYPLQIVKALLPHFGVARPTTPGLEGVSVMWRDDEFLLGGGAPYVLAGYGDDVWAIRFWHQAAAFFDGTTVGPMPLPATTTDALGFPFDASRQPLTDTCGWHSAQVGPVSYMSVGYQEAAFSDFFGGTSWAGLGPASHFFLHPSARPFGLSFTGGGIAAFRELAHDQQFDYVLACVEPPAEIHIWDRWTVLT